MMEGPTVLLLFLVTITGYNVDAGEICTSLRSVSTVETITTYYKEPQITAYQSCFGGIWPCKEKTKSIYVTKSRDTNQTVETLKNVTSCCNGYTGTPPICNDVDECLDDIDGCSQHCHNTDGSYYCSCENDYTLASNGKHCIENKKILKKRSNADNMVFYIGFPKHYYANFYYIPYKLSLSITTYDAAVSYQVERSSYSVTSGVIAANSNVQISLGNEHSVSASSFLYRDRGLKISTDGLVNVLLVSSGWAATGEYPAYPHEALGLSEYVYYAVSTGSNTQFLGKYGQILLVGNEDSTQITIIPSEQVRIPSNPQQNGSPLNTLSAGVSKTFTLNEFQTLLITATATQYDLTGSKIVSNKPLSVISGHECGNIPTYTNYCEHVVEFVPPTVTWGKEFIVSHYETRGSQYYKILASKATGYTYNCGSSSTTGYLSSAGAHTTIKSTAGQYCYIEADQPILVTQMSPSSENEYIGHALGDPAISIIPPMDKYLKTYSFHIPNPDLLTSAYASIISKKKVNFSLKIGLSEFTPSWTTITDNSGNTVGYGTSLTSPIAFNTVYTITNSADAEFYVIVYAFGNYKAISFTPVVSGDVCDDGYTFVNSICTDINECATDQDNCENDELCSNTPGSFVCIKLVNECDQNTDDCNQICTDTQGSYVCSCNTGYKLNGKYTCIDVDECASNLDNCQHTCINNDGSYKCKCNDGYTLHSNGNTCTDINECNSNNGGCSPNGLSTCHNTPGSYYCSCATGYHLDTNDLTCIDTNECSYEYCQHKCVNTPGSYYCECLPGYYLSSAYCYNINECNSANGGCSHTCTDTEGSYHCTCPNGYTLHSNKKTCIDNNECNSNNGGCDHNCNNNQGSYTCSCYSGYSLDTDGLGCTPDCPNACNSHCSECVSPNQCSCDSGWTGSNCCDDINECAVNNGGCKQNCQNAEGSFTCKCGSGYTLKSDGFGCDDINECTKGTDECSNGCTNTIGSYLCYCPNGYELDSDLTTCVDTNECDIQNGGCDNVNGECINTVGSYYCQCNGGYQLKSDGYSCEDKNECSLGTDDCNNVCLNNVGSYTCGCLIGYTLGSDELECEDINECAVSNGGCDHTCANTDGSYYCQCLDGFELDSDNHGCSDHNECTANTDECEQICHNSHSSYYCNCNIGYILNSDGRACDDINECTKHISGCAQSCTNTVGSYTCNCYTGFTLNSNGKTCNDINECYSNDGGCGQLCENNEGSFECYCNSGYKLNNDQMTCSDLNECILNTDKCAHQCINTLGSYSCSCETGYKLGSNGLHCDDINECLTNKGGCDDRCVNTPGTYHCECDSEGYILGSNKHSCDDINECDNHNGDCDHTCVNTPGDHYCECNNGYSLDVDDEGCLPVCADSCNQCTACVSPGLCTCYDGWTGNDCCTDINECLTLNGGCTGNCHNADGSFSCTCNNGFTLGSDGKSCNDINECNDGSHICNQVCTNTVGSYKCSCNNGYELGLDKKTCVDTDECAVNSGGCDQDCSNNIGSYECSCIVGYTLSSNSHGCDDIDECALSTDECSHDCYNNVGSYSCDCAEIGYELDSDDLTCVDIDECADDNGKCDDYCHNSDGSYTCSCKEGSILLEDNLGCTDLDECTADTDNCDQVCHNTKYSYYCTCNDGYKLGLDGHTCIEINECTEQISGCNQVCTNTEGSYECSCYSGYVLSSGHKICEDIDECLNINGGCDDTCTNIGGSYECSCDEGFELDNDQHQCNDIDECELSIHTCEHICDNTVGTFTCACKTGFELSADGVHCSNINECQNQNGDCDHNCFDNTGSYYCTCADGYSLNDDGRTCDEIDECLDDNGGCDQLCTNTNDGSYFCNCTEGYLLDSDDKGCLPICPDKCGYCTECVSPDSCTCADGWTGSDCCEDINECATYNAGCQQICLNANGSFHCSCRDGYSTNDHGYTCDNINECLSNSYNDCNQQCTDTIGSYLCYCDEGYALGIDYATCEDIDECGTSNGGCSQICINNIGSYYCGCGVGYNLNPDDHACDDINECNLNTHNCSHNCSNTIGSYTCDCDPGYILQDDNSFNCTDLDECADMNAGCNQTCTNTIGSYECSCLIGYFLDDDEHGCSDHKECDTGVHKCDHTCHNSHNSYYCTCDDGYILEDDGRTCTDINECLDHLASCNQICNNTDGSYTCDCFTGYELKDNNRTCIDIDECSFDNGGCNQTCTNTIGSYTCSCDVGYKIKHDQHGCDDIDECVLDIDLCEHNCFNNIGSYYCTCQLGYYRESNGFNCTDVNECDTNNGGCNQTCVNEIGSYYCECDHGEFILDQDSHNCTDVNECEADNGGCQHNCHNLYGTYACSCFDGYDLLEDSHSCYGQQCNEMLIAPINGSILCSGEQITNESCTFRCDPGYMLHESAVRTCQANHNWTGVEPYCTIRSCNQLERPRNGFIVSDPCFTEFTSRCEVQCVEGYIAEDSYTTTTTTTTELATTDRLYQECLADPTTNTMYWSDPPECIYKPPCTSSPCLNGGVCRDVSISEYKCDCTITHYKGLRCDIGIVYIPQAPILYIGETAILTMEAYPTTELHVYSSVTGKGIELVPTSDVSFNAESTTASVTVQGLETGIHFIHYELSGEDAEMFDTPKPMIVIVRSNTTVSNPHRYFDDHNQPFGILKQGCCDKQSDYFSCPNPMIDLSLLSSCSWVDEETFGVVFAGNEQSSIPVGVSGAHIQDHYPFMTLPSSQYPCSSCNTQCGSYDLTEEDIIDFINTHTLARSFLFYTSSYLPSWINFKVNEINSDTSFYSYDVITDIIQGKDVILIDGCENLDISSDEFYTVLRYNDSLVVSVDDIQYSYLPQFMDMPICFAISLCDYKSPIHVSVPSSPQLEQIDVIKNFIDFGWVLEIFELSLSADENDVSFTNGFLPDSYIDANYTVDNVDSNVARYQIRVELNLEKKITEGNTTISFVTSGICYLPEEPTRFQGLIIGDTHLNFNSTINGQIASLYIEQSPTIPIPFVLPGYSNENTAWSNGAYFQFNYVPSDFDQFFSSILPIGSNHCPADMFVIFDEDHNVESMIMTTSSVGLNILGLNLLAGTLEHKITIELNSSITIESKLINGDYQVNEFLKIKQPSTGYAISVVFYTNGTVSGHIKEANLVILGSVFSTTLYIGDKLSFSINIATTIYNVYLQNELYGVFGSTNDSLVLYLNGEVTDGDFIEEINLYTTSFIQNEINFLNDRLDNIENSTKPINDLFYYYTDVVTNLLQEYNDSSVLYEAALDKIEELKDQLQQYQTIVNGLQSAKATEILSICEEGKNCSDICAVSKTCGTCNGNYPVTHWGIGLIKELENVVINSKPVINDTEWTVGYFCRLITKVKSWGKTNYGQICSYKSGYEVETKLKWASENSNCNVSHFRPVEVDTYPTPYTGVCLSNNTCGMYLQPSECVITDSACHIAQLQMINSLNSNEAMQLDPLKNLIETKIALSVASTLAEEYRYRRDIANCSLASNQNVLNSLYNHTQFEIDSNYDSLLMEFNYIKQIESLPFNNFTDLFDLKRIFFDVTIGATSPSSFPLVLSFEVPFLNTSSEISVTVDFSSPKSIIKRDIASSVVKHLSGLVTNNRRRRSCDIAEPSHNEHHFEQYCAIINNVKNYLLELNNSINFVTANAEDLQNQFTNIVDYMLLDKSDIGSITFNIDIDTLNACLNSATSKDELLDTSFSSEEYVNIVESLKNIENISSNVAASVYNTAIVSWWTMINNIHQTSYNRIIDDRKCFGFADCIKSIINALKEIINDSFNGNFQIVDPNKLLLAEAMAMDIIPSKLESNNTWTKLELLYEVTLDVEMNTHWCIKAPVLVTQPDPFVYVELGSNNTEIKCGGPNNVSYSWLKNGFPIIDSLSSILRINQANKDDAAQYQCLITNPAGTDLSAVSELRVYVPPVITLSPSNISTFEGDEDLGLFICNATGYPTPVYEWYFSIDKINWELVGNGSNEYVSYKPTNERQGWYKCRATIYNKYKDESEAAFLSVIGASVSTISYIVNFTMAIYIDPTRMTTLHNYTGGAYEEGLGETILTTVKRNEIWRFGYIDNMKTHIDNPMSQFDVSFHLNTHYDYSVTMAIADQADEANIQNNELLIILENLKQRVEETSLWFQYEGDFMYAIPPTFVIYNPIHKCPDGQRLLDNTFICVDCAAGYHSTVINNIPTCVQCEQGTYNGQEGQGSCTACPEHQSTIETGLLTDETCSSLCPPDTNSSDGFVSSGCISCTNGTYQSEYGSTYCMPCSVQNKTNQSFERCYVPLPILEPIVKSLPPLTLFVSFVSAVVIIAVIAILIITIVIASYKWNAKRVKDKMMTRTELNDRRRGIILPDFAPHGESRLTTNPLYNSDETDPYAQIGQNPLYFDVEELNELDGNADTRSDNLPPYPFSAQYMKQKGEKIRKLRKEFECREQVDDYDGPSEESYDMDNQDLPEEGPWDSDEEFFKLPKKDEVATQHTYETVPARRY